MGKFGLLLLFTSGHTANQCEEYLFPFQRWDSNSRRLGQEHPPLSTTCVTRFGVICKIFKALGKFLTVFFLFGKMLSVLWQNFDIANGQILKNTTTQSCAFPFALEHTGSKERGSVHFLQIWHKSGKVTEALNTFAAAP